MLTITPSPLLFLFLVNRQQAHGLLERERERLRRLDLRKLIISITPHCASALFCSALPSPPSSPLIFSLRSLLLLLRLRFSVPITTTTTITESEGGGGGADGSSQVSPPPPPARHHLLSPGSTHTPPPHTLSDFHSYVWKDIADLSRPLHLHLQRRLFNSTSSSSSSSSSHLQCACVSLCF
jgi:hypothetical protein